MRRLKRLVVFCAIAFGVPFVLAHCGGKLSETESKSAGKGVSGVSVMVAGAGSSATDSGSSSRRGSQQMLRDAWENGQGLGWLALFANNELDRGRRNNYTFEATTCTYLAKVKINSNGMECTMACANSNQAMEIACTVTTPVKSYCGSDVYTFSSGTIKMIMDYSGVTISSKTATGILGFAFDVNGAFEGGGLSSATLACKYSVKIDLSKLKTLTKLTCADISDYSCTFGGKEIPCSALETSETCTSASPSPSTTASASPTTSSSSGAGSCTVASTSICTDYKGSSYTASTIQASCSTGYSSSSCTSTNRLGTCTIGGGTSSEQVMSFYSGGTWTSSSAQSACSGTWSGT